LALRSGDRIESSSLLPPQACAFQNHFAGEHGGVALFDIRNEAELAASTSSADSQTALAMIQADPTHDVGAPGRRRRRRDG
jgi:hypothetical protein